MCKVIVACKLADLLTSWSSQWHSQLLFTVWNTDVWVVPWHWPRGSFTASQWERNFWHLSHEDHCQDYVESCDSALCCQQRRSQHISSALFLTVPSEYTRKTTSCFGLCTPREKFGSFPLTSAHWDFPWSRLRSWILMQLHCGYNIWLLVVTACSNLIVTLKPQFTSHKLASGRSADWPKLHHFAKMSWLERPETGSHTAGRTTHSCKQALNAAPAPHDFPSHSSPLLSGPTLLCWSK